jgi:hypothetical protein
MRGLGFSPKIRPAAFPPVAMQAAEPYWIDDVTIEAGGA